MRQLAGLLVCWLVAALLAVWATGTGLAAGPAMFLVLAIPYAYAEFVGRRRRPRRGLFWKGFVTLDEAPLLAHRELFPTIRRRNRREKFTLSGTCAGKAKVSDTGISWKTGALGTPTSAITGSFELNWSDVRSVDTEFSGKALGFLGGILVLRLSDGRGELRGEFIGPKRGVQDALHAAQDAYASQNRVG